ncbi:hypothetical protein HC928_18105 [bacterium]|nr:hypothetical protein [bacterium]
MPNAIPAPANLAGRLPIRAANTENYVFEIATAISAGTGDNPTGNCGTPPVSGNLAVCRQTFPYGEFYAATKEFNVSDGNLRRNITDMDRRLVNQPQIVTSDNPFVPMMPDGTLNINTILGKEYIEFGHFAANAFTFVHIQGLTTRNNTQTRRGFISEYAGLDAQIITGTVDSVSSTACAAADAIVNTTGGALDAARMGYIIDAYRGVQMRASQAGMEGTQWAFIAHPTMKDQLFDTWACNYATTKCDNDAGEFSLLDTAGMRDQMKAGNFLMIDGQRVPVIFDWGMALTINASTNLHTSDIFLIPLSWGGRALTFLEYQPMDFGEIPSMLASVNSDVRVMNNGFYLMGLIRNDPFCFQHAFTGKFRLILEYRFLSARVDDITYTPTVTYRTPDPAGAGYVGGGVTTRT